MKNLFICLFTLFLLNILYSPVRAAITNVPIINANSGEAQLDANNWTTVWAGKVSSGSNYFDARIVGYNSGVFLRIQLYDSLPQAEDSFIININGVSSTILYGNGNSNGVSNRCETTCRGWSIDKEYTWEELKGKPNLNDVWNFSLTFNDKDSATVLWSGNISWGLKAEYLGSPSSNLQKYVANISKDASIGGGSDCGNSNYPDYFPTWGTTNYGNTSYLVSQNQWDVADWPCFGKNAFEVDLTNLNKNVEVKYATLNLSHFGENGYGNCYEENASKDTVYEIYQLKNSFDEYSINWDNTEIPSENISRANIKPARAVCNNGVNPPFNRVFDITENVKRSLVLNKNYTSFLMYTSAGQYHSGKQFYSKEGSVKPFVEIFYTDVSPSVSPTIPVSINPKMDVNKDNKIDLLDVFAILQEIFE